MVKEECSRVAGGGGISGSGGRPKARQQVGVVGEVGRRGEAARAAAQWWRRGREVCLLHARERER